MSVLEQECRTGLSEEQQAHCVTGIYQPLARPTTDPWIQDGAGVQTSVKSTDQHRLFDSSSRPEWVTLGRHLTCSEPQDLYYKIKGVMVLTFQWAWEQRNKTI